MKKSLVLASLLSSFAFATGPSMVDARIQPLSMNDRNNIDPVPFDCAAASAIIMK